MDEIKTRIDSVQSSALHLDHIFTKEDLHASHLQTIEIAKRFVQDEVLPVMTNIENKEPGYSQHLIQRAGELGMVGSDTPSIYGGTKIDKIHGVLAIEEIGRAHSFATTYVVHTGLGSLPIIYYGTETQKKKFLPSLASGEIIGAFALTEPGAGSNAFGITTTAKLTSEGDYYVLNGEKQYITNANFAGRFIICAKTDEKNFTAFIVEKDTEGLEIGSDLKTMGIKGSSTAPLYLNNVKVPKENILGDYGKGHQVAFNSLNMGRYKMSADCLGKAKYALELGMDYMKRRDLTKFTLLSEKVANIVTEIFAAESMIYRAAGAFEQEAVYSESNKVDFSILLRNFAPDCSINKVFASETLDYVVDEIMQIHGGYGYLEDQEIEKMYRDARIGRIYEGTNEINRLIIANTILKDQAFPIEKEIEGIRSGSFEAEWEQLKRLRSLTVNLINYVKAQAESPAKDQEWLGLIADLIKNVYVVESTLARAEKYSKDEAKTRKDYITNIAKLFTHRAVSDCVGRILLHQPTDQNIRDENAALFIQLNDTHMDMIEMRRKVAWEAIQNGY